MAKPKPDPGIDEKKIPTFLFSVIASLLVDQGVRGGDIVRGVGIDMEDLSNAETRISYRQLLKLIDNALTLSPDPALGLSVAAKQNLSDWGLLGYALSSCRSAVDALRIGSRYYQLSTALSDFSFTREGDEITVQLDIPVAVGHLLPFIVEESFGSLITVGRALGATNTSPTLIRLSYSAPSYREAYRKFFRCPIQFNQPVNQMVCDLKSLEAPFPSHNPAAEQLAIKLCEEMLSEQQQQSDIVYQIRQRLIKSPGNFPTMTEVAREMSTSERTLRRQLSRQNISFQSILDSVREKIAIEYLKMSRLPLEDIAYLVGFSEVGSFHRAFKKWTGKTPLEYRG